MLNVSDFCINRCCAGGLSLKEFIKLANDVGVNNIELRTDIHKGSNLLDDMPIEEFNELQRKYNVHVANISAKFNFDDRTDLNDKVLEVANLAKIGQKIGAKNILLTPIRNPKDIRIEAQKFADLVYTLRIYSDILGSVGVNGLIEPLGFSDSSLRYPWTAQNVLQEADAKNFKLIADTFHYYKAGITEKDFKEKINVNKVGLIHLSSIVANKSPEEADDNDRYFIADDDLDVMHTITMAKWFKNSTYCGLYSFEPCALEINNWNYKKCKLEIETSIQKIIYA